MMSLRAIDENGQIRVAVAAFKRVLPSQDIYATAAIVGISAYLVLRAMKTPTTAAFIAGVITVAAVRLAAIVYGLQLPVVGVAR